MAVGTGTRLEELEYSWYAAKAPAGMPSNAHIDQLQRAYWISVVGEQGTREDTRSLELRWLRSLTGVASPYYEEAWMQAVAGAGGAPQGNVVANKVLYYKTVA